MTAQIIPFPGYEPNTRLNLSFTVGTGLSAATMAWLFALIVRIACAP